MVRLPSSLLPVALPVALFVTACGGQGSFELRWSIACQTDEPTACAVKSAKDCADAGIDAVETVAVIGSSRVRSVFPCFGPAGPVGDGPGLPQGPATLEVSALSPGGQLLVGPVAVSTTIPGEGNAIADVTLPRPFACNDGVDNDGDGLVDLLDPDCRTSNDTHE